MPNGFGQTALVSLGVESEGAFDDEMKRCSLKDLIAVSSEAFETRAYP